MTTPERWKEIDHIFAAALELEPAERAAFLDEACAGDELVRQEVESLLANDLPESLVGGHAVLAATRLLEQRAADLTINRIGRYQIIRSLGAGGMGRVYLGLDEQLNRPVAVKLLSNYNASAEERLRRFRREALSASALNHPNILTIYEIGEFEGTNFITAEFVDGVTLRARIKADALPLELALDIAIQIASALSAAHAAGIIHRDIKCENVMVRADGLVKVLDFGIAKFTQAEDSEKKDLVETMPGAIIGTAAYMSPEQARGALIDTRSDIWSLGVILYEMVARRLPFWGNTQADVMAAILERQPPPLPTHGSVALESVERIIFKALQKERKNRYQTAAELLTDLKQLRQTSELVGEQERLDSQKSSASQGGIADPPLEPKTVSALPVLTSGEGGTTGSSAAYVVDRIKHHKRAVLAVLVALIAAAGFLAYRSLISNKNRPIESIAVMPFVNESGSPDVEYLSDGMTESVINSLSQLPGVKVIARSSTFKYKGKEVDSQEVARALGVEAS
jgi:serine/threonine protein kinase